MLKLYEPSDKEDLLRLIQTFYENSGQDALVYSEEKTRIMVETIYETGQNEYLAVFFRHGDRNRGLLVALIVESQFSTSRMASELVWWVDKDLSPFVRGKAGLALIEAFEYWAEKIAKADLVQIGAFDEKKTKKLFIRKGYKHVESTFIKGLT